MASDKLITQDQLKTAVQRLDAEIDESLDGVFDGHFTGTIGTTWTENDDGTKTQTVAIDGILAKNNVLLDHDTASLSQGYSVYVEEENQFLSCITNGVAETVDGGIVFKVFSDSNTVSIPIIVEVI